MAYQPRFPILLKLGLSDGEAEIFELLVQYGTQKARDLVEKSSQSRGNVYNLLTSLIAKRLVLEISGKQKRYQAVDPSRLKTLLDKKREHMNRLEAEFQESLHGLSSLFTLSTGKPAIQYFEGIEGTKQALADALTAKTEVLTIIDPNGLNESYQSINQSYIKRRNQKGIPYRVLLTDSKENKAHMDRVNASAATHRMIQNYQPSHHTVTKIYDNRVAFFTLKQDQAISIIVTDPDIYESQKALFEHLWKLSHTI